MSGAVLTSCWQQPRLTSTRSHVTGWVSPSPHTNTHRTGTHKLNLICAHSDYSTPYPTSRLSPLYSLLRVQPTMEQQDKQAKQRQKLKVCKEILTHTHIHTHMLDADQGQLTTASNCLTTLTHVQVYFHQQQTHANDHASKLAMEQGLYYAELNLYIIITVIIELSFRCHILVALALLRHTGTSCSLNSPVVKRVKTNHE